MKLRTPLLVMSMVTAGAINLGIAIVDSPERTEYIDYVNNERDGLILESGTLEGERVRIFINDVPTNASWCVYVTKNLNEEWVPFGMSPYGVKTNFFFDLPMRATNYFFKVDYTLLHW
jgi:hypothetical protein